MKYIFLNQSFYPVMSLLFSEESLIYAVIQMQDEQFPNNLLFVTKTMLNVLRVDKMN